MKFATLFHTAFTFWVVLDPLGNIPIVISLLRPYGHKRQQRILMRELFLALLAMYLFLFFGIGFFNLLRVESSTLELSGGIILFLIAIRMVFAMPRKKADKPAKEPFIVPIAIPAIAGPGILALISLYGGSGLLAKGEAILAITLAWAGCIPFLMLASFFKKWLGENGLVTVERLFGYMIILLSTQMALSGLMEFFKSP